MSFITVIFFRPNMYWLAFDLFAKLTRKDCLSFESAKRVLKGKFGLSDLKVNEAYHLDRHEMNSAKRPGTTMYEKAGDARTFVFDRIARPNQNSGSNSFPKKDPKKIITQSFNNGQYTGYHTPSNGLMTPLHEVLGESDTHEDLALISTEKRGQAIEEAFQDMQTRKTLKVRPDIPLIAFGLDSCEAKGSKTFQFDQSGGTYALVHMGFEGQSFMGQNVNNKYQDAIDILDCLNELQNPFQKMTTVLTSRNYMHQAIGDYYKSNHLKLKQLDAENTFLITAYILFHSECNDISAH